MDLKKVYDTIDRVILLQILEGYGVGPQTLKVLQNYWLGQLTMLNQGGFLSGAIAVERVVTQRNVVSATLFNILVDTIIWYWGDTMDIGDTVSSSFYANDGLLQGEDSSTVQAALDFLLELFKHVGLQVNTEKTNVMIVFLSRV